MTLIAAAAAATAVFLLATRTGRESLPERLAAYLTPGPGPARTMRTTQRTVSTETVRRVVAALVGTIVGAMLGASSGAGGSIRPIAGMALAGAATGFMAVKVADTQRRDARRRRLRQELPTAADAVALHVLAGESIPTALDRFCAEAGGAVATDLHRVLRRHRGGATLPESLSEAARAADHPDAARLYETLAHAHQTGGRLAEVLAALAADFRAAIARDLVAEGGRRALATYGPILALQIPVTLLFLMYPTLVGLGELSAAP